MRSLLVLATTGAAALGVAVPAVPAVAAPPAPCQGQPQISDPRGDGHHQNTDVIAAWFSEANGRLQAVVQVDLAVWEPAHDDSTAAGLALTYLVDGVRRYVRVEAVRGGPPRFDQGTWTRSGGFTPASPVVGEVSSGAGGAATIDLPELPAGVRLSAPFVLTYDGEDGPGQPHWVDRAPGGTSPDGTETGGDYVVGSCSTAASPGPAPGPGDPALPPPSVTTTQVLFAAPSRVTGGGTRTIGGRVLPARGGVPVTLTITGARTTTRSLTSAADGTFSARVPFGETVRLQAAAEGIRSPTRTVTVASTVAFTLKRLRGGVVRVRGTVRPALPGRVLFLRDGAVTPSASTSTRQGRFTFRLRRPRPGRYQAVFIPTKDRAERSVSKTGAVR